MLIIIKFLCIYIAAAAVKPSFDRSLKPTATIFPSSNKDIHDDDVAKQISTAFAA